MHDLLRERVIAEIREHLAEGDCRTAHTYTIETLENVILDLVGWTPGPPECPVSPLPSGKHQVDTSMESGPNNCFFCEQPMPSAGRKASPEDTPLAPQNREGSDV